MDRERALNLQADTRLKGLKEAQLRKELAPIQLLELCLGKICSQISSAIGKIPERIKKRVPKLTKAELEIVRREIVNCQNAATEAKLDLEYENSDGLQDRSI